MQDRDKSLATSLRTNSARSLRQGLEEMILALGLFTRLPLPSVDMTTRANLISGFWCYPVVGALIGAIGGMVFVFASTIGLGSAGAALIAMMVIISITGALHEDGLADFFDGLGGGNDTLARLRIMSDSRIGTYGAVALIFAIALQVLLLSEIADAAGAMTAAAALMTVNAVSRVSLVIPLRHLKPAKTSGMAMLVGPPNGYALAIALFIGLVMVSVCSIGWLIPIALGSALGMGFIALLARRYLGGYTGDVFGAGVVAANVVAYFFLFVFVYAP